MLTVLKLNTLMSKKIRNLKLDFLYFKKAGIKVKYEYAVYIFMFLLRHNVTFMLKS